MLYPQYGIYLIPPPAVLYPMALAHHVMSSEFNAHTAGRFMVHCTMKGFFKLAEGVSPDDFTPALDKLMAETPTFQTSYKGLWTNSGNEKKASFILWLERTPGIHQLHNAIWDIVRPYIAPDCRFSPREGAGPLFTPHITLAMADLPTEPGLREQALGLGEYMIDQLPKTEFTGRDMQLIEFESQNWEGSYWDTLRYRQLKGWRLPTA